VTSAVPALPLEVLMAVFVIALIVFGARPFPRPPR
jgi:hypothetical protein